MLLSLLCELFGRACFRFVAFFFGKLGSGMAKAGRISGAEGTLCLFGWELAGSRGLGFFWASSGFGGRVCRRMSASSTCKWKLESPVQSTCHNRPPIWLYPARDQTREESFSSGAPEHPVNVSTSSRRGD